MQHRVQELGEELQDTKIKGEKIPGLLAEIARLRGGTRASIKALAEQDKLLSHLKTRVKQLEKENALLKNDNRALQDVELKLKEAIKNHQHTTHTCTTIYHQNSAATFAKEF